ncbi:hypothetical protein KMP13_13610 [Epibacterium ulvae]|uniref:hypothetical protein n=1 Tax=Epibacterium ulvae TaxID=1156985 RepID=UPI001BFCC699|nr:hypothetical protein [Epibacterium ulvae]MBT8154899.1 hypothetical protein [Epibacterium ulvae]
MIDANLLLAMVYLLGPIMALGIVSFYAMFRFWAPIAAELDVTFFDSAASRRVLFAGVMNADPELKSRVRKLRLWFFACYAAFFVHITLVMGIGAVLFLGSFFAIAGFLTRPFELGKYT